jgi:signal transduction histidine kinase/DNA-binding response OmpR family regulator
MTAKRPPDLTHVAQEGAKTFEVPEASTSEQLRSVKSIAILTSIGLSLGLVLLWLHFVTEGRDGLIEAISLLDLLALSFLLIFCVRQWREAAARNVEAEHAMAALTLAKQTAENANLAKSRYLASVSHEIRSPLNAIYGYAQLFERGDGVNAQEAARVILRCSEHLTYLVEGLLDIAQLEFGMLRVRIEEVRLRNFVEQIISMMRPAALAKGLDFHVELPARLPEMVRFDQDRFRQVLINLLSNAIKFTQQGSITLKVKYSGQIATFEVHDTGPGIAVEDQARLFERFERGSNSEPGAGLGLAISQTLVGILGGKLELESDLGCGSCFRVVVMMSEVPGKSVPSGPARKIIGYDGRPRKILLVEDDADQRQFLERLLRALDFEVVAKPDGIQALTHHWDTAPDLAILDLSLPGLSGWEIASRLRDQYGDGLQILILSANSDELHRPEHANPEHDRFLVKPVEFEALVAVIGDLLTLNWRWQGQENEISDVLPSTAGQPVVLDETAKEHLLRLQECLRIGYVRGIESEIKQLETCSPNAALLARQLYDCLDRYDLNAMTRLLQEY